MPDTPATLPAADLKQCCATSYSGRWAQALLGNSFHPGGLNLTRRLGGLLQLGPGDTVLDVASGKGSSALALAEAFGCRVVGVDLDEENLAAAREVANASAAGHLVRFEHGDAEQLPFGAASFDALVCECAFCLFPAKAVAAAEFARVLRPGGRVGLSDVTFEGALPEALETLAGWVACIADARPAAEYAALLSKAGIETTAVEHHPAALTSLLKSMRLKLLALQIAVKLGKTSAFEPGEIRQALDLARHAAAAIKAGPLGFAVLVATRAA